MKILRNFLFLGLFIFMGCEVQKSGQNLAKEEQIPNFFLSGWNGGDSEKGYIVITDDAAFSSKINSLKNGTQTNEELNLPKDEKVVVYNFGMRNSGSYIVKNIQKIELTKDTLKVYLPHSGAQSPSAEGAQIQVISYPWMAFSIPENYEFNYVEIK